jgi:hypothetical protein
MIVSVIGTIYALATALHVGLAVVGLMAFGALFLSGALICSTEDQGSGRWLKTLAAAMTLLAAGVMYAMFVFVLNHSGR